jgi:hypothetical protein
MKRQYYAILSIVFMFAVAISVYGATVSVSAQRTQPSNTVCPDSGSWTKKNGKNSTNVLTSPAELYWSGNTGVVTYNLPAGASLDLCIKGGRNAFQSNVADANTTPPNSRRTILGLESSGTVTLKDGKDISHVSWIYYPPTESPKFLFQFVKVWAGDVVNLDDVKVTFYIGELPWVAEDGPVEVKPGTTLEPLSEKVTGLPDSCSYESDLPSSHPVFPEYVNDEATLSESRNSESENGVAPVDMLDELVVTNTVTCVDEEDDDTTAVLSDGDEKQVAVTPVGAADAGGAGTTALVGLVGSTLAVSLGAVIRKFSL